METTSELLQCLETCLASSWARRYGATKGWSAFVEVLTGSYKLVTWSQHLTLKAHINFCILKDMLYNTNVAFKLVWTSLLQGLLGKVNILDRCLSKSKLIWVNLEYSVISLWIWCFFDEVRHQLWSTCRLQSGQVRGQADYVVKYWLGKYVASAQLGLPCFLKGSRLIDGFFWS